MRPVDFVAEYVCMYVSATKVIINFLCSFGKIYLFTPFAHGIIIKNK
jgi:hypothetical protein